MTNRIDVAKLAPKAYQAVLALNTAAGEALAPTIVELVKIRASQLNGCGYCLHMHVTDARKMGETDERMHMITVWKEATHFFTEQEQAALALTESVTLLADHGVPDDVYERAAKHFDDVELAHLIAMIVTINAWNRIAVTTAKRAGTDDRQRA